MKLEDYLQEIEGFLRDYLQKTGLDTYVLGLSGGVDSSLVAALCAKAVGKQHLMCIMMPIESHPSDLQDALFLAKHFDLPYLVIDGTKSYEETVNRFIEAGQPLSKEAKTNLKVRIRMTILYAYAQTNRGLVVGTDNADERYTGYFTKYGDGGVDLLPIMYLTKGEVVKSAKLLGIPDRLAERVPTAGLFPGQTDEGEMGVLYKDLDAFLLGENISEEAKAKIERLHRLSAHKRDPLPAPAPFEREKR